MGYKEMGIEITKERFNNIDCFSEYIKYVHGREKGFLSMVEITGSQCEGRYFCEDAVITMAEFMKDYIEELKECIDILEERIKEYEEECNE